MAWIGLRDLRVKQRLRNWQPAAGAGGESTGTWPRTCICGLAARSCLIMRTVSSANASCCREQGVQSGIPIIRCTATRWWVGSLAAGAAQPAPHAQP